MVFVDGGDSGKTITCKKSNWNYLFTFGAGLKFRRTVPGIFGLVFMELGNLDCNLWKFSLNSRKFNLAIWLDIL